MGLTRAMPSIVGFVALLVGAYLLGSVPVGFLVARWRRGIDIRKYGTGNVGASNTFRNVGRWIGVGVAAVNILESALPTLLALSLGYSRVAAGLVGFAAAIGYAWPVFLRFSGGRAVAVTGGVIIALWTIPSVALSLFFIAGMLVKRNPLTMFVGFGVLPIYLWASGRPVGEVILAAVLYAFMMSRRLVGLRRDLRGAGHPWRVALNRLVNDRRPGQTEFGRHQIGVPPSVAGDGHSPEVGASRRDDPGTDSIAQSASPHERS
jgi:acyl phosphate:glycerol-3-phosphate acyltransferase